MTVAAIAVAGLAVSTAACAGDESDLDGEGGGGGGTINMQIGEVRSLIPGGSGESEGYRIIKNVYDGLIYYDRESGEPVNLAAEDISSPDNQVWTIKIKDGLTFQNGEPVDADAFIRSWDRTALASNALPLNYFFATFEGYAEMNPDPLPEDQWADPEVPEYAPIDVTHLSGVTAVDDLTIEVKLSAPFIGFPTMLGYEAFLPVAEACLADTEACEKKPIGNGPFMFEGSTTSSPAAPRSAGRTTRATCRPRSTASTGRSTSAATTAGRTSSPATSTSAARPRPTTRTR
nr:hypothetical protein GCM10025732_52760 [Glycomyces mayteni]